MIYGVRRVHKYLAQDASLSKKMSRKGREVSNAHFTIIIIIRL